MNCFEARQDFAAFWRRELTPERRGDLVGHLTRCPQCENAFRTFAITAPVLHSKSEPASRVTAAHRARANLPARRPATVVRGESRAWRYARTSAAAMVLVAASLAAYLSVTAPIENLNDELSAEPIATQMMGSDLYPASEDLAG